MIQTTLVLGHPYFLKQLSYNEIYNTSFNIGPAYPAHGFSSWLRWSRRKGYQEMRAAEQIVNHQRKFDNQDLSLMEVFCFSFYSPPLAGLALESSLANLLRAIKNLENKTQDNCQFLHDNRPRWLCLKAGSFTFTTTYTIISWNFLFRIIPS